MVTSDRPIYIAINSEAQNVYGDTLVMDGTSVSALYFKNTNTTNTATVEFVVTD